MNDRAQGTGFRAQFAGLAGCAEMGRKTWGWG